MIDGSQVLDVKDSRKSDGIEQLLRDWHGIPIQLGLPINWTVIPIYPLLRLIIKDILL